MSKSFQTKLNQNGTENPKYVDLLEEDKPISGQKFVCLSFLSPEKILKDKKVFFFEEFLKHFDFAKSVRKFTQFLNFLSYKYSLDFDKIMKDFDEYSASEKGKLLDETTVKDEYQNFLDTREDDLQGQFDKEHDFKCNTRGLKVRGTFQTQEEAQLRCRMLREVDPNHDIYVGQVGFWMPFEPDAYKTGRVEYLEEELNELMNKKNKSQESAKKAFSQRVRDSKRKAIEENIKKAKITGNKLTQTITEDGDLVGVGVNTIERRLENAEDLTSADIRKELFEGENIRTKEYDVTHPGRRHSGAQPLPDNKLNTVAEEAKPFDKGQLKEEYKNLKIDVKK
jgi:hypothetical protein